MVKKLTSFGGTQEKKEVKPVFGIDLGTTNSAISIVRQGRHPETIKLSNDKYTMPSCVMYHHGKVIVGTEAYENRGKEGVVYSVKRLMQDPNAVLTVKDGNEMITVTPVEVSAEILKGLVEQAGDMYGRIEDVIVTVPAYFNQNGVSATRKACEMAGLNLIAIANEPAAASLCYNLKSDDDGVCDVIVYDLGGGTFDVTVMRISDKSGDSSFAGVYGFEDAGENDDKYSVVTLGISGDMVLGGDDVDLEMLKIAKSKLTAIGVDVAAIKDSYWDSLLLSLEKCKKSGVDSDYRMPIKTIDKNGHEVDTFITLNASDFKEATGVIFRKTKGILDELLSRTPNRAKSIVLTGGSTKNPFIRSALHECYPQYIIDDALSPDLSVSQGAAIQGFNSVCDDPNVQIFDILPISIGVLDDGAVSSFIPAGTSLPTIKTLLYTTVCDNQRTLSVKLYQGNSTFKELCVPLGVLTIDDIEPQKAGEPNLSVTVKITADRRMTCIASVDGKTKELTMSLAGETGNIDAKVDKTVKRFERALSYIKAEKKEEFRSMIDGLGTRYSIEELNAFLKINREEDLSESK